VHATVILVFSSFVQLAGHENWGALLDLPALSLHWFILSYLALRFSSVGSALVWQAIAERVSCC
jgi:hypothetical protein